MDTGASRYRRVVSLRDVMRSLAAKLTAHHFQSEELNKKADRTRTASKVAQEPTLGREQGCYGTCLSVKDSAPETDIYLSRAAASGVCETNFERPLVGTASREGQIGPRLNGSPGNHLSLLPQPEELGRAGVTVVADIPSKCEHPGTILLGGLPAALHPRTPRANPDTRQRPLLEQLGTLQALKPCKSAEECHFAGRKSAGMSPELLGEFKGGIGDDMKRRCRLFHEEVAARFAVSTIDQISRNYWMAGFGQFLANRSVSACRLPNWPVKFLYSQQSTNQFRGRRVEVIFFPHALDGCASQSSLMISRIRSGWCLWGVLDTKEEHLTNPHPCGVEQQHQIGAGQHKADRLNPRGLDAHDGAEERFLGKDTCNGKNAKEKSETPVHGAKPCQCFLISGSNQSQMACRWSS